MIARQKFESPVRRNQPRRHPVPETTNDFIMNEIMQYLFELQTLEFDENVRGDTENRIAKLRAKIPPPILDHYDRLGARGKKGLALIRHQICTGCHIQVPLGVVLNLKRGGSVCLCDNCQRYLYLPEDAMGALDLAAAPSTGKSSSKQLAYAL